jgi:hypothetical protein
MQGTCTTSLVPAESTRVSGVEVIGVTEGLGSAAAWPKAFGDSMGRRVMQVSSDRDQAQQQLGLGPLSLFGKAQLQHALKLIPTLFAATPSRVARRPRGDSSETGRTRRDDTTSRKEGSRASTVQKGSHTSGQVTKRGLSTDKWPRGDKQNRPLRFGHFPRSRTGFMQEQGFVFTLADHPGWARELAN